MSKDKDATVDEGVRAAEYAKRQVGKPYIFGESGPESWDCSGLTMVAWGKQGYQLDHYAATQAQQTLRVNQTGRTVRVGDLAFYYLPISHVSIFVGKDRWHRWLVVAASAPGLGVQLLRPTAYAKPVMYGRVHRAG